VAKTNGKQREFGRQHKASKIKKKYKK